MRSLVFFLLFLAAASLLVATWALARGPSVAGVVAGEGISAPFTTVAQEACRLLGRGRVGEANGIVRALDALDLTEEEREELVQVRRAARRTLWMLLLLRLLLPAFLALAALHALLEPGSRAAGVALGLVAAGWIHAGWTPRALSIRVVEPVAPLLREPPPIGASAPAAGLPAATPAPVGAAIPASSPAREPAPPPAARSEPRPADPPRASLPSPPPPATPSPAPPTPPAPPSRIPPPSTAGGASAPASSRPNRFREPRSGIWMRLVPALRLYVSETEVTVAAYRAVTGAAPDGLPRDEPDDRPVRRVTAAEAERFARSIGTRLPTAAEFRALQQAPDRPRLREHAWGGFWGGRTPRGVAAGKPVGGLFDLTGNVAEWVREGRSAGGSAISSAEELEAGGREQCFPAEHRSLFIGFRVCREID